MGLWIYDTSQVCDDVCCFAPSFDGLQDLANICSKCAKSHCIMFNAGKSMDMIFHEQFSKYFYA